MGKQFFFTVFVMIGLFSCNSKQDFGYDEKMTSLFYACRDRLDEHHKKLLDGVFDNDLSSEASFEVTLKEAKALGAYCNGIKAEASALQHSEAAGAFHADVLHYMAEIADRYTPLLTSYVQLNDTASRRKLKAALDQERQALSNMEHQCLQTQVALLKANRSTTHTGLKD